MNDAMAKWLYYVDGMLHALHGQYEGTDIGDAIKEKLDEFSDLVGPDNEHTGLTATMRDQGIRLWHATMEQHYPACERSDKAAVADIECELLTEMRFHDILDDPTLDDGSRAALWEYVRAINACARTYVGDKK